VHFNCGNRTGIDINPVKRHFYAACNSILVKSHGADEPVRVQLIESYCLLLLVYCIGTLRITRTSVQQVCWNDAFRTLFHYKRFKSCACKVLLVLWTLITCTIYIGRIFFNFCIKDVIIG